MSLGKYSPTVSMWYAEDQDWWHKNGGGCVVKNADDTVADYTLCDKDGYDSYGYHYETELDRAGNSENEYVDDMLNYWDQTECEGAPLYEDVSREYSGIPAPTCANVQKQDNKWVIVK